MTDIRPLWVTGNATEAHINAVREAKAEMGLDYLIQFARAQEGDESVTRRVMAFQVPDFACDYALVTNATTKERMLPAMEHVLGVKDHPKGVSMAQWLSNVFGKGVTELEPVDMLEEAVKSKPLSVLFKLHEK